MREIITLAAKDNLDVEYIFNFKNDIFFRYDFKDEKEEHLITETLSILEYSTQYWADKDKTRRWEIFRHDPINPNNGPTEGGCGNLIGSLYGMYSMDFLSGGLRSSLFDVIAYGAAAMYVICINSEYAGTDNLGSLAINKPKLFCSYISASASSW